MTSPAPSRGRKSKPLPKAIRQHFLPLDLLAGKAARILRQCGAPAAWGSAEVFTMLRFAVVPSLTGFGLWSERLGKALGSPKADYTRMRNTTAAELSRLLHEAPDAVFGALPKLRRLYQQAFQSPEFTVTAELGMRPELWNVRVKELAPYLRRKAGIPLTEKVLEHAKSRLRKTRMIAR